MPFQKGHIINLGKKFSEETKQKIGLKHKGKVLSEETKQKMSNSKKGIRLSEQHRQNLSLSHKGNVSYWKKGEHFSLNTEFKKGHKHSEKMKKKISLACKGVKKSPRSKEHRRKISDNNKRLKLVPPYAKKGAENMNWRGGISFKPYTVDWTKTLKQSIRERDKYICQVCGEPQGDRTLCIHHIDYIKQNCNPDNLISLCIKCHTKTNHNRKYWTNYFNKK